MTSNPVQSLQVSSRLDPTSVPFGFSTREAFRNALSGRTVQAIWKPVVAPGAESDQRVLAPPQLTREPIAEKGKSMMKPFEAGLPPPNVIPPRPSDYALDKLSAFEYVGLWYFSRHACSEAKASGYRVSHRHACADHELTFPDFLNAKNTMLHYIKGAGWPDAHVDALAGFFFKLESHPIRTDMNGDEVVLQYASRVRRKWHDDMKYFSGPVFNIALINDALMDSISS